MAKPLTFGRGPADKFAIPGDSEFIVRYVGNRRTSLVPTHLPIGTFRVVGTDAPAARQSARVHDDNSHFGDHLVHDDNHHSGNYRVHEDNGHCRMHGASWRVVTAMLLVAVAACSRDGASSHSSDQTEVDAAGLQSSNEAASEGSGGLTVWGEQAVNGDSGSGNGASSHDGSSHDDSANGDGVNSGNGGSGNGGSGHGDGGSSGPGGGGSHGGAEVDSGSGDEPTGGADSRGESDSPGGSTQTGVGADGGSGGHALDGDGTPEVCSFTITGSLSSEIPTVGVVDWSMDLLGVTEARIDFELVAPDARELNIGSGGPIRLSDSPAWLLGLKQAREYTYRITVTAGETVCVSPDQFLTTGSLASPRMIAQRLGPAASSQEVGFILNGGYSTGQVTIIDADGETVWSVAPPSACSRVHMDWNGEYMWMMNANASTGDTAGGNGGEVVRIRMDGTGEEPIPGFERAHHDFTVLPDGTAAFLVVVEPPSSGIVERAPDGTLTTIVVLNDSSYLSGGASTHPNALHYWPHDESYTVSDLSVSSIINFDRQGNAQWQVGGYCADPIEACEGMNLTGTHGHHWLESGNLLVFLAGIGTNNFDGPDPVVEYSFNGSMASANANLEWYYTNTERSLILGDVERLPNGNTLITYSATGVIQEVTQRKELVRTLTSIGGGSFGYSSFRKTLYGPRQ